jgi:hypothetical protein
VVVVGVAAYLCLAVLSMNLNSAPDVVDGVDRSVREYLTGDGRGRAAGAQRW